MDRAQAQSKLKDTPLVPCTEASLLYARELESQLLEAEIPAILGKPPAKDCCSSGGCACASRFQVLVAKDDFPKAMAMFQDEFARALAEEGLGTPLVPLGAEPEGEGEPPCPACGHAAALVDGACAGCGLQLE
jgi:hypothetical protein